MGWSARLGVQARVMRQRLGLYAGFAATGVGVAMPGALLPLLLRRWNLGDTRGGVLLFCFFLASTAGALLSRGVMNRSVARGALFTAAGAVWLAMASRGWGFAAMSVYGFGLGVAMTSTSLLVSRRFAAECRVEMMRLNLLWAAGACLGPWMVLGGRTLRSGGSTRPVHALLGLAGFFAAWTVWMWFAERDTAPQPATEPCDAADAAGAGGLAPAGLAAGGMDAGALAEESRRWALLAVPVPLMVLVFCATGTENATGGWLAAYAQRLGATAGTTIGAATAFWAGVLASRMVHSVRAMERVNERVVLRGTIILMALGLAVLVAWPGGAGSVAAALLVGFGAGPVYPLLLAMVLRERETRGVFVLAGAGASAMPLLTGAVSGWTHSLTAGLTVPLAAAGLMTALALRLRGRGAAQTEGTRGEMVTG